MNRPQLPENRMESYVSVPADALDDLLEAVWLWAFEDWIITPLAERDTHIFNTIVLLDSALHGISVEESWVRIRQREGEQFGEQSGGH